MEWWFMRQLDTKQAMLIIWLSFRNLWSLHTHLYISTFTYPTYWRVTLMSKYMCAWLELKIIKLVNWGPTKSGSSSQVTSFGLRGGVNLDYHPRIIQLRDLEQFQDCLQTSVANELFPFSFQILNEMMYSKAKIKSINGTYTSFRNEYEHPTNSLHAKV